MEQRFRAKNRVAGVKPEAGGGAHPQSPQHGQHRGITANRQRPGDSDIRLKQRRGQGKHQAALPRARNARRGRYFARPSNVSADSFRQASGQSQENPGASPGASDNAILAGVPRDMTGMRQLTANGRGLVDLLPDQTPAS